MGKQNPLPGKHDLELQVIRQQQLTQPLQKPVTPRGHGPGPRSNTPEFFTKPLHNRLWNATQAQKLKPYRGMIERLLRDLRRLPESRRPDQQPHLMSVSPTSHRESTAQEDMARLLLLVFAVLAGLFMFTDNIWGKVFCSGMAIYYLLRVVKFG